MKYKAKNKPFYLLVFIVLCLVVIFEVFAYTHYVGYLKAGGHFDLGVHLQDNYTKGFTSALGNIVMDVLSLILFFLLPFVLQLASMAPVTVYVYIAYGLNIIIGLSFLLFSYFNGEGSTYSSADYETTTIKTTYDLSSGEMVSQSIRTPQDKADAANFWLNVLILLLFITLPYIALPILMFLLIKKAAFVKDRWYIVILLLLLTLALTAGAGYGLSLLV